MIGCLQIFLSKKISTMNRTALSIEIGKSTYQLYKNRKKTYRTDEKKSLLVKLIRFSAFF